MDDSYTIYNYEVIFPHSLRYFQHSCAKSD
jgi:hypothetical protein